MKKRGLKIVALLMVSVMTVGMMAGCGSKKEEKSDGGKTTITLGMWDVKQSPFYDEAIAAYEAEHPDVNIEVQITPYKGGEYWTKLEASAAGGTAPDVFWINVLHAESYFDGGILKDLSDVAEEVALEENYPEALVEAYNFSDQQIGLPKDFDTNALWYNKDIFDKAGVEYPTDDWTYEDLVATATELKEAGLEEGVYPFVCPVDFQTWYYPTVFANGGWILNDDKTETGYADPKTQEGIQCWIDMIDQGLSPSSSVLAETSADTLFGAGQTAMVLAGSYMTPEYLTNDAINKSIDLVEFPEFNGEEPNVINGLGYAVFEGTKHEKEAKEFVAWLMSEEAMKLQGEAGTVISARNDAQHFFADSNKEINLAAYTNHADKAVPLPVCKVAAELYDLELSKLKLAYAGEESLEEVCKELKISADELLGTME
ncbi:ABC transporter substrate-binding protein [Ohessyouella blattaphilus]|uniref:Sugar ABC transporter substrate-binding protein n=1 Tax=Ohessyouella blattaphilus TaxID=2949333 RepID=A0ABT1EEG0_9FIRM|nr:sugar ABC transporter substrate-binding protein [Ohessyouella blattaphilus]MCP1109094.1 sugar ABC transporter substrate-binding protein [Ohessyouella blattaphilus]MCR8562488.1 sugar ABC transporter substrate-binding protein [Ohessyouella blattaphilus]